jgi:Uma2 family endonuclease
MSTAEQKQTMPRMTYEEFLDWADEDTLAEWVDGEIVMTSPASARHQQIKMLLVDLMRRFVELHGLGLMMDAPFQVKLPRSGREPDILFIATAHLNQLKNTYLDGPADLTVEIVSPESIQRGRINKYAEYASGKVPEYWLIDPDTKTVDFYQLDPIGQYQSVPADAAGIYHSRALPGFWLRVDWLWQEPLPDVEDVAFEIMGQPYLDRLIHRARRHGLTPGSDSTK